MAFQVVGSITFCASIPIADKGQLASLAVLCAPDCLAAGVGAERVDHALSLEGSAAVWVLALSLHCTIPLPVALLSIV